MERELTRRRTENRLAYYQPYDKQRDFHNSPARERLLMAGNQLGKTLAGGFECAMHATGRYPEWWQGRRFDNPTVGWVAGVTGESTRDNPQRVLLGRPGDHGSGAIPKDALADVTPARGVPELVDTATVKHVSGGLSRIGLKSYEKGREKWQGETLDYVWFDEEPPPDIYTEGMTRTNVALGPVWMTFTPLLGMSEVVRRFLMEQSDDRAVVTMTIDDALHYTGEERARIIASYPEHEREARVKGVPTMGSGRVFPVADETIAVDARDFPKEFARIRGVDFGWDHPFAAVELVHDRDTDVVYVVKAYRQKQASPIIHAAAIRAWGDDWVPVAWPHDGLQVADKQSGENLATQYRAQKLDMLSERATFDDGSNGVEAGLMAMLDRMHTSRLKVFKHLNEWFDEFRLYHRKDGKVVKEMDDLMSATRYALMMIRYAKTVPEHRARRPYRGGGWQAA